MGSHVGLIGQGGALTRSLCYGDVTVVLLRYRGYCQFVYFLCCLFVVPTHPLRVPVRVFGSGVIACGSQRFSVYQ